MHDHRLYWTYMDIFFTVHLISMEITLAYVFEVLQRLFITFYKIYVSLLFIYNNVYNATFINLKINADTKTIPIRISKKESFQL